MRIVNNKVIFVRISHSGINFLAYFRQYLDKHLLACKISHNIKVVCCSLRQIQKRQRSQQSFSAAIHLLRCSVDAAAAFFHSNAKQRNNNNNHNAAYGVKQKTKNNNQPFLILDRGMCWCGGRRWLVVNAEKMMFDCCFLPSCRHCHFTFVS